MRPASSASTNATGTVAALILPYFCTVTITLCIGTPAYLATDSIMRKFAWCGTTRSISSAVTWHCSITRFEASAMACTARLKIT